MEERTRYAVEVKGWNEGRIQVVDSDLVWQQRLATMIDAERTHTATNFLM